MIPAGALRWKALSQEFWLLPQRALWWEAKSALMVSDLHLAKAEHFRSQGLQVPPTVDAQTLSELTRLLTRLKPKTLLVLGDLFHSAPNKAWDDFGRWLQDEHRAGLAEAVLVRGNHDRASSERYEAMGMAVVDRWEAENVCCTHAPDDEVPKGQWVHFCGHVHPAARLRGAGRQHERVPCFHAASTGCDAGLRMVLPAFGKFTGTHAVEPRRGSEVFLVAENAVLGPWKPEGVSRRGRR